MSGPFNTPQRARKPAINITPLIDVMFLLLIFFMVSSTFRDYLGIDVTLPQAGQAASQDAEVHRIVVDREGRFFLGSDRPKTEVELENELKALVEADQEATFILEADQEASFGRVVRAIDIAKKVGGERLIIPTDPLGEDSGPRQP